MVLGPTLPLSITSAFARAAVPSITAAVSSERIGIDGKSPRRIVMSDSFEDCMRIDSVIPEPSISSWNGFHAMG
jgi:hypothetical protein